MSLNFVSRIWRSQSLQRRRCLSFSQVSKSKITLFILIHFLRIRNGWLTFLQISSNSGQIGSDKAYFIGSGRCFKEYGYHRIIAVFRSRCLVFRACLPVPQSLVFFFTKRYASGSEVRVSYFYKVKLKKKKERRTFQVCREKCCSCRLAVSKLPFATPN